MKTVSRLAACIAPFAATIANAQPVQPASLQLEFANDIIVGSDNQFTNGLAVHHNSRTFARLEDTGGTLAFGKFLAVPFLPESPGLTYRETWVFGQSIQTPAAIEDEDLILNDVPYAGGLAWSNSFYTFDNERFFGFQWLFGIVGEQAGAKEVQRGAHAILGGDNPEGWDNQLDTEPLLNLYYSAKYKLFDADWIDLSVAGDVAAGNLMTFAQAGLELRFGDTPGGFTYIPDPIGRGMDYDATLRAPSQYYFFGSAVLRATSMPWSMATRGNLLVDDNPWTENNTIDPETNTAQLILGLHYLAPTWGAHLTLWLSSDSVDKDGLASSEDPRNSFGSLLVEYRF
ncbi:lipid A deacylase LpxR family protein [Marinobacter nanhaiticus D15-8W]|uniref:Lipid A deacylase LpxR family protein n=1 Tax=Marinobacter nanhaiticus D15-8W TaxID=626887 RepID=N6X657_9GAMM|nr:lipid A deacylase LpxR family protein [Marinobacter nanhaiticus]ENO16588.1 lipid A deacylase LpxR family protein [Marinobacter nanhaiticus D15-8W]BES72385.1 lipid A deacylase LpxR family protein [Marinobacter nanhaiticus D15-8W]